MKINSIIYDTPSISDLKKKDQDNREYDFQTLLKGANAKLDNTIQKTSSLSPSPLSPLNGLMELNDISQIRSQGIQASEDALKILEEYQKIIGDNKMPFKRIDQLIQSLSQEVHRLGILSEKLSPSDPLKKILTELGIVSSVEIEKYHRGDYF